MGPCTGYWPLWHLSSRGHCYCALGAFLPDAVIPEWRSFLPRLPSRDRYSTTKALRVMVAFREARKELVPPPGVSADRLLYFAYMPWSLRQLPT